MGSIGLALASSLRRLRALTAPLQRLYSSLHYRCSRWSRRFVRTETSAVMVVKRGSHFAVSVVCRQEEGSGRKIKQRDQAVRSSLEVCPTPMIEAIDRTAAVGIANNGGIVPWSSLDAQWVTGVRDWMLEEDTAAFYYTSSSQCTSNKYA
jgi:hypothetical protein